MTDDSRKLRETLDLLCRQLEQAGDSHVARRLRVAVGDYQDALESDGSVAAEHASLADHLIESAAYFEQSHPMLSGTLRRLIDILGQMGI
jgi:hypothetical protein